MFDIVPGENWNNGNELWKIGNGPECLYLKNSSYNSLHTRPYKFYFFEWTSCLLQKKINTKPDSLGQMNVSVS